MTEQSSPPEDASGQSSLWPTNFGPYYRPALIAGLTASVGIIVGSIAPWAQVVVFSVGGLDFQGWGATSLFLGALSGVALVTELLWARTRLNPKWMVPVGWVIAVAGAACLTVAVVSIVRLMTIPKATVLGITIGPAVGWGLWLVAFASVTLCVSASIIATQLTKNPTNLDEELPISWNERWKKNALAASALVVVVGIVYAMETPFTRDDVSHESGVPSALPTMPSFPNFFPTSHPDVSTTTTTTPPTHTSEVAGPTNPNRLGDPVNFTFNNSDASVNITVFAVDQSSAPNAPSPTSGGHWVSADVRTCLNGAHEPIGTPWDDWTLVDSNDGNYEATNLTYSAFPTPEYPNPATMAANECVRGWVVFAVADGVDITKVKFRANSKLSAYWSAH